MEFLILLLHKLQLICVYAIEYTKILAQYFIQQKLNIHECFQTAFGGKPIENIFPVQNTLKNFTELFNKVNIY